MENRKNEKLNCFIQENESDSDTSKASSKLFDSLSQKRIKFENGNNF